MRFLGKFMYEIAEGIDGGFPAVKDMFL